MNTELYQTARQFVSAVVLTLLSCGSVGTAYAQSTSREQLEFDKLANAYHSNRISETEYLNKADSLTHQLFSEGMHFETHKLADLLGLYEQIAWSGPEFQRDRASYFYLFMNNARMFKKWGASMYYAEKIAEEYKKMGIGHPLIEQLQKTKIYQELRLYDRVISVYADERDYLANKLPQLLRQDSVDQSVGLNAMYILSPVLTGYIKRNDTAAVYQTARLTDEIGQILRAKALSRPQMLYNDLLMIDAEHSVANFEQKYDSAHAILNRMEALKTTYRDQATNFIDVNLVRRRLENYLHLKNTDSIRVYLEQYQSSPVFGDSQRADVDEFEGQLRAMQGNYPEAYASLTNALTHERDLQAALMAESSDLLYAYTQAEHNEIAAQRAEQVKQQRTVWLIIVSFVALLIVFVIYFLMRRRSQSAKEQLEALNNVANMHIIAMEEAKLQAVKEEQQRLGQDLHDGLASSVAGISHQLDILMMDTDDPGLKTKLTNLRAEVANVYETTRSKSHEWFNASGQQQEQSFEAQIKLLTDSALPDNRYQKKIHIDDNALRHVNPDTRIILLRIIQEAITNIIKHARAKNVGILIYEESDNLFMVISDDGKGLGEKQAENGKITMGLQSIRRRVQLLNGQSNIQSNGANGTELTVSVPLNPLSYQNN